MTYPLNPDNSGPKTPYLPFAPGELDRSGLRLTRAEFARFLQVSKQAVTEWVQSGKVTLGADGRLDPRQAVGQLLRNTDPTRLRARVLAPLVRDVGALQRRILALEVDVARWKEEAEFHEGAALELAAQLNGLVRRLRDERAGLAALPGERFAGAIQSWLDLAQEAAGDPGIAILDCPTVSDADILAMGADADRLLGAEEAGPGALEQEKGGGALHDLEAAAAEAAAELAEIPDE